MADTKRPGVATRRVPSVHPMGKRTSEMCGGMAEVSAQQIRLLQHTLGLDDERRVPYRNHFVAGPGHHDMLDLEGLEAKGLMQRVRKPSFLEDGDIVFAVTDVGRTLAIGRLPPAPVRSRYNEYLDIDGHQTFGEHICGVRLPKYEQLGRAWDKSVRYRMYREGYDAWDRCRYREVVGEWRPTKKAAKASYKEALAAHRERTIAMANKQPNS